MPTDIQGAPDLLQLAGNTVDTCMSLSFAAIQFRCRQEELYAKLRYEKLTQKLQAMEAHYRKKINMMNQGFEDMKQRVESLKQEKQEMEGDIRELRDKYSQKTREARSLRAQVNNSRDGRGGPLPGNHAIMDVNQAISHLPTAHGQVGGQVGGPGIVDRRCNSDTANRQQVHGHSTQGMPGISGLPSRPIMGHAQTFVRAENRLNSHESPTNLMPRSRSPHHPAKTLAYGPDSRYASPYATPARSSPSMLMSTAPMGAHRTPPSGRQNGHGGLRGLGPMVALGGSVGR